MHRKNMYNASRKELESAKLKVNHENLIWPIQKLYTIAYDIKNTHTFAVLRTYRVTW